MNSYISYILLDPKYLVNQGNIIKGFRIIAESKKV